VRTSFTSPSCAFCTAAADVSMAVTKPLVVTTYRVLVADTYVIESAAPQPVRNFHCRPDEAEEAAAAAAEEEEEEGGAALSI
jgi:hypothetical protein